MFELLSMFEIAQVDGEACMTSLQSGMKDYEDAVLAVCVKNSGADCIATRDFALLRDPACPVKALQPDDLAAEILAADPD